jgi:prepilin-type N-terminal cleavage/methylation domain-containing protein
MKRLRLSKSVCACLGAVKSEKGFTLVELLVAMLMLTLIVFAFTPLLVGSMERIHFAGDKSEALYLGQSDLEVDIAERNTVDGHELVFTFGDTVITVPGGLAEAERLEGSATAWLSGFVPFVPSINLYLAPLPLVEGYDPTPIVVMGQNTDFELAKTQNEKVTFYDSGGTDTGHTYGFDIITLSSGVPTGYDQMPEDYDQYAKFTLDGG